MDLVPELKKDFECFKSYKGLAKSNLKQVAVTDEAPVWDLSFMYSSYNDKKILSDIQKAQRNAKAFYKKYSKNLAKGKLPIKTLLVAIKEYETIIDLLSLPISYLHAELTIQLKNQELLAKLGQVENIYADIMKEITFFENDLSRIPETYKKKIAKAKELNHYRNFFDKVFKIKPHLLPQELELLLIDKDINGRESWQKFRDVYETKFSFMFKTPEDKEVRKYSLTEMSKMSKHRNSQTRFDGVELMLSKYKEDGDVFTYVYNSIIQDMIRIDKGRRGFKKLITRRNMSNELSDKQVAVMIDTVAQNYKVAQRYWKLKAKILGLGKLKNTDVYAPYICKSNEEKKYTYKEAISVIQNALDAFYKPMGELFENMYRCNLVHAKVIDGKAGGAYCTGAKYKLPSIVLSNFQGEPRDVSTLAHEGGHWIHHAMMSENQTALTMDTPLTTAETASIFNEMIIAEAFIKQLSDKPEQLLQFMIEKIDDIFATVFRQTAFSKFEQSVFDASEAMPLTQEQFSEHFVKEYGALFGDAVEMTPHFKYEWARIPHFIHTPFYVYAYSFGELATIALYQFYKVSPKGFGEKYMKFLASGSEKNPEQLYKIFGIDINKKETWAFGFKYINSLIDEVEALASKVAGK